MRAATLALLVLLCAACTGPDWRGINVDKGIYRLPNQHKTMLMLERDVEEAYGVELDNLFMRTRTYFVTERCPYRPEDAAIIWDEGHCLAGIMWSCSEMYVAVNRELGQAVGELKVCHTALAHEFGHCLLGEMGLSMDAAHENQDFWDIVGEVDALACDRGW